MLNRRIFQKFLGCGGCCLYFVCSVLLFGQRELQEILAILFLFPFDFGDFNLIYIFLLVILDCVLQRLKDEIAEVANEIENLGSTEER